MRSSIFAITTLPTNFSWGSLNCINFLDDAFLANNNLIVRIFMIVSHLRFWRFTPLLIELSLFSNIIHKIGILDGWPLRWHWYWSTNHDLLISASGLAFLVELPCPILILLHVLRYGISKFWRCQRYLINVFEFLNFGRRFQFVTI